MEFDTVSTVDGSIGEGVISFSPVIDSSVDRHHDGNDHDGNVLDRSGKLEIKAELDD